MRATRESSFAAGDKVHPLELDSKEGQKPSIDEMVRMGSSYGVSKKGYAPYNPRKKNQDALHMCEDPKTQTQTILVLDGHGEAGELVSSYFKTHFCEALFRHPAWAGRHGSEEIANSNADLTGMREAVTATVQLLEHDMVEDKFIDTEFSGTTLAFCALRRGRLLVANVGDSRVTLCTDDGHAAPLSVDHKPDKPAEKARILACGGRVFAVEYDDGVDGPPRVWLGHLDIPGLAMSRSIGDVIAHSAGVSSEPEFFDRTLTRRDAFLVSATDGLWEFLSDQDVVDVVLSVIRRHACDTRFAEGTKSAHDSTVAITIAVDLPKACVQALIDESNRRWMSQEQVVDDTTVVLAFLQPIDDILRIFDVPRANERGSSRHYLMTDCQGVQNAPRQRHCLRRQPTQYSSWSQSEHTRPGTEERR